MDQITLKQLRYFEALARNGHFGRAAEACAISQPALSMQIRELEASAGAALFERGARQVRLTGLGEAFAVRAREVLRAVDELTDLTRVARGRLVGRLRIGVIPTVAPYLLPTLLGHLAVAHAGLDLHVRESLTHRLIRDLADGDLDTAIVALPVSEPAFVEQELFTEAFMLVRPAAEEGQPVPGRDRLREMRLLLLEEGHCFRDQALSFCNLRQPLANGGFDAASLTTLVQMVAAGIGVTLIPEMAVPVEARSAAVSLARLEAPEPTRTIGMIWRRTSPLADQLSQIADVVRMAAASLPARQDGAMPPVAASGRDGSASGTSTSGGG